jgi:hypothetical protein
MVKVYKTHLKESTGIEKLKEEGGKWKGEGHLQ